MMVLPGGGSGDDDYKHRDVNTAEDIVTIVMIQR